MNDEFVNDGGHCHWSLFYDERTPFGESWTGCGCGYGVSCVQRLQPMLQALLQRLLPEAPTSCPVIEIETVTSMSGVEQSCNLCDRPLRLQTTRTFCPWSRFDSGPQTCVKSGAKSGASVLESDYGSYAIPLNGSLVQI
jgi:hypothetical protein